MGEGPETLQENEGLAASTLFCLSQWQTARAPLKVGKSEAMSFRDIVAVVCFKFETRTKSWWGKFM